MIKPIGLKPLGLGLLLPVAATQGLFLKRRATRLPGAPGPRQGTVGTGHSLHLLAAGDSIIDGVGTGHTTRSLPYHYARVMSERNQCQVHWRIEGESGLNIQGLLQRLQAIPDEPAPDQLLVSIGVNDVTGLSSNNQWRHCVAALAELCSVRWPGCQLLFAGLPPMGHFPLLPQPLRSTLGLRAHQLDSIAQDVLRGHPFAIHIPTNINPEQHDFCEDGFHPSAESCNLWADALLKTQQGGFPK